MPVRVLLLMTLPNRSSESTGAAHSGAASRVGTESAAFSSGDAGFAFSIPERCTPTSGVVPTAQEVAPWVAVIERLWDDPEFEAAHRRRALAEAMRWESERLATQFEDFFRTLLSDRS
jgi:hypothetical protein